MDHAGNSFPAPADGEDTTVPSLEAHFRLIADHLPALIAFVDSHRIFRFSNRAHQKWWAKSRPEVEGRPIWEVIGEENYKYVRPHLEQALRGSSSYFERQTYYPGEGERWVSTDYVPARDAFGKVVGVCILVHDLTQKKQIEESLKREQLLESQLLQAQKMEALGTLAGGVAHDFNNILSAILGFSDLARRALPNTSPALAHIEHIFGSAQRARKLIQQILTFSKRAEPQLSHVSVRSLVLETVDLMRAALPSNIEFTASFNPPEAQVRADHTQLLQVLLNICTNAGHAMREEGGRIDISVERVEKGALPARCDELGKGPWVLISVRDTGSGMSEEVLRRIFEPYFTTKKRAEGSGLGLSVAMGIVANHGGMIAASSKPGAGSVFDVYLPEQTGPVKMEAPTVEKATRGEGRILFVDDERILTELGRESLTFLGYEVSAFSSSTEALAAFTENPEWFDLVITDQTMPGMLGDVLIRMAREIRPDIPAILCTGYGSKNIDLSGEHPAADALLSKPFSIDELSHTVSRVLGGKRK